MEILVACFSLNGLPVVFIFTGLNMSSKRTAPRLFCTELNVLQKKRVH